MRFPTFRSTQVRSLLLRAPSTREHIMGVSVIETMPEAKIATIMVTENSRKMRPIMPVTITNGRNTTARETVMAIIVNVICRALLSAASRILPRFHQTDGILEENDSV